MKRKEFDERIKMFRAGDWIKLFCRGNYGSYAVEGKIIHVSDGRVYLDKGFSHSYRRIAKIT